MATPSYSNFITQIVKRLKEDTRLRAVRNDSIFAGANPERIQDYPAITVSLERVEEHWRTFAGKTGGQKDAACTVRLTVLDRLPDGAKGYTTGLKSVEDIVQTIDNIVQSDTSVSGVAYKGETSVKTFTLGEYDNTPVIGADIELISYINFTPASRS